ncbi:MAG: hypothetical protein JWL83_3251 [Actinomycetia bacterium]|nr:hypothetical protein [Actinomycetes bacterium]
MRNARGAAGIAALMVILLAACGSSSHSGASGAAASSTTPSTVKPGTPEPSPSGDIPDNQAYVAYTMPTHAFVVKVPEGWSRREVNGVVSFTDKLNTITLQTAHQAAAPTIASVTSNELPAIARSSPQYVAGKMSVVTRHAGSAVLATYHADGTPNALTGKTVKLAVERYAFWRNGTEAVLTLSGPVTADNVDPWKLVTNSFAWA